MAKSGRTSGIGWKAVSAAACTAIAIGAAPSFASASDLVAEWRFDEGAGQSALDAGPFGLDGRLGADAGPDGADPERIAGASSGALHFDGSSFVALPASSWLELQAMTVEAVVRAPASPGRWRYVLSRGGQGCYSGSYGLYTSASGGIALYVFDGARYVISATARREDVWDGGWHHVAGTFDGSSLRLYVDGRPVGEPMGAPVRIDYARTSDGASIGQYAGGCDLAYRGDIDLMRLSDRALGPEAIASAALGDKAPAGDPPAPLVPAAAGTVLDVPKPDGAPAAVPDSSRSTCAVHLSRTRLEPGRRTVVHARVGVRRVTVVARPASGGRTLAKARTSAAGVARLVIRAPRSGRLTVSVHGRPACTPAGLRIVG